MNQDLAKLTRATPDDLQQALAFALRFNGKKRYHQADSQMADIVAMHLIEHLERCRFVVLRSRQRRHIARPSCAIGVASSMLLGANG
jgi:hypothetical protein